MTHFEPSDADILCQDEPEINIEGYKKFYETENWHGFNFLKLLDSQFAQLGLSLLLLIHLYTPGPVLLRQVAGCVFDYIFHGEPRSVGGPDREKLVEYGFARLWNINNAKADEPLALLAAAHFFSSKTPWTIQYFLHEAISSPDHSAKGLAFEKFAMYALALSFKKPKSLSEVFTFISATSLANEPAHLVSARKVGTTFEFEPVDISSSRRPIYCFGRSPSDEKETLSWMEDPNRTAWCFPAKKVGPDFIGFLRLRGGTLTMLGSLKKSGEDLSKDRTIDAFQATDPNMFISEKVSYCTISLCMLVSYLFI